MKTLSRLLQSIACLWLVVGFSSPAFGGVIINSYRFPSGGGGGVTDPYFANVLLLLHCDGTNGSTTYTDSSTSNRSVTAYNGAALSTTSPKFGTASSLHDGTDDYVDVAASADFSFGTSTDFTVEFWLYADSTDSVSCGIGQSSGSYVVISGGNLFAGNGAQNLCSASYTGYYDKWTHIAFSRSGSTPRLFCDGNLVSTGVNYAWGSNATIRLMSSPVVGGYGKGKIDDLRITTAPAPARYTAAFTPPAPPNAPFPDS